MSKQYCFACNKKHEGFNWLTRIEDNELITVCDKYFKPSAYEIVPQYIKDERLKHLKSQIPSHRDGDLSKEWVESYPQKVKERVKAGVISQKEVKNAKRVWQDLPNINNLHKTQ